MNEDKINEDCSTHMNNNKYSWAGNTHGIDSLAHRQQKTILVIRVFSPVD